MANMFICTDGTRVSESGIKARYSKALKEKHGGQPASVCEGCGQEQCVHNDHTIAKARCKVIHKTELIWHHGNFVSSCERCHKQWENFKSGEWLNHLNVVHRLLFLKTHDPEGYNTRVHLTALALEEHAAA